MGGIRTHIAGLLTDLPTLGWRPVVHGPTELLQILQQSNGKILPIASKASLSDIAVSVHLARQLPADAIVHAHGIRAAWICTLAQGPRQFKFVTSLHNIPPRGLLSKAALHMIATRCTRFICVSKEIERRSGVTNAAVIPNGVDTDVSFDQDRTHLRTSLGLPTNRFLVLCAARLSYEKGVDVLLQAAAMLSDHIFVVAGDGPLSRSLQDSAPKNVIFLGQREDVVDLMRASDCVVAPSRSEGQGIGILEAFAAQTPVVATSVGGVPESVVDGETGFLVPPENPAALAEAISAVRSNPDGAKAMAVRSQLWVKRHRRRQYQSKLVADVYSRIAHPS
jgi:glycosyltransferase involved in cell wall biosynthesis